MKYTLWLILGLRGICWNISKHLGINTQVTFQLYGLTNSSTSTIGTVNIKIFSEPDIFNVVSDDFLIPFDSILGTFFLERYKAIIDCKNNYLIIRDRKYDIYRSTQKGLEDKTTQVININHNDSPFCNLNYVNVYNKGELMGQFLIDSGAEGSVISEKIVPKHLKGLAG